MPAKVSEAVRRLNPGVFDENTHRARRVSNPVSKQAVPPALVRSDQGAQGSASGGTARPHVSIVLYRCGTQLDTDQKYASVKWILDALVECGQLPGDKEGDITLEVSQERVAHRKEEKTVVEITTP